MHFSSIGRWIFIAALGLFAVPAAATAPIDPVTVVGDIMQLFEASQISDTILEAAKSLFWSLALISLVWTMGMLIVRQDIGELLMELLRFIIITGLFYWVLINASSRQDGQGFIEDIVMSFLGMVNDQASDESFRKSANDVLRRCLHVFFIVINETADGQDADRLIVGAMVTMIVCIGAVMAAQFLIALVMAWILGYAGIFLLGFGGARWTSPIAINYYKHVVAVGIAMLALSLIGAITVSFIDELGLSPNGRNYSKFDYLGLMLAVMILMQALAIRVPQLLYTLVTGSTLGLYAGSANAAGTAIAAGGSSAYAAAIGRSPGGNGGVPGGSAPGGPAGSGAPLRAESVMDAVHRSASIAGGMADPFHVNSGADPFGAARAPDVHRSGTRHGSVFGPMPTHTSSTTPDPSSFGVTEDVSSAPYSSSVDRRPAREHGPAQGATKASPTGVSGKQDSSASISNLTEVGETTSNEYFTTTRMAGSPVSATSGAGHHGEGSVLDVEQRIDTAPVSEQAVGSSTSHGAGDGAHVVQSIPGSIGVNESGVAFDANRDFEHARTIEVLRGRDGASTVPSATVHVAAAGHEAMLQGGANESLSNAEMPTSPIASTANSRGLPAATLVQEDVRVAPVSEEVHGGIPDTIVETPEYATRSAASTAQERHAVDAAAAAAQPKATPPVANDLDVRGDSDAAVPMQSGRTPGLSPGLNTGRTPATDADGVSASTGAPDSPPATVNADGASPLGRDMRAPTDVPTTSIVQEDMKTAPPSDHVQVVMPGAIAETAAPAQNQTASEDAAVSGDPAPGRRKHRARRRPDDAPPVLPPVDSDEPLEDDQP